MIPGYNDERAVSETVGFILIFGIVVISMGFIYTMGYPILQSSMETSIFESTEQSFIVLQSNMKMVSYDQVPVKNLKLKMHSASLSSTNQSSITIEYDGKKLSYPTGEIEYRKDDNVIVYENGGVWKRYYSNNGIMVSDPHIYSSTLNGKDITTIGVVSISGRSSSGGNSIVNLNMKHNSSTLTRTSDPVDVTIKINNTYASVWKEYLEGEGFTVTNFTDSNLTAKRNNTMLVMSRHVVDVQVD